MLKKNNKGFFIIEALVAIFVFMIGVLGVIQLQLTSMQAIADAQYRSQASYMAENLAAKITFDQTNISSYVSGNNTEYLDWLDELKKVLPGVNDNPPTITIGTMNGKILLTIQINWKSPHSSTVSRHRLQNLLI